jgi:hypothetical protein
MAEYHRCMQVNEHRINLHFLEGVEKAGLDNPIIKSIRVKKETLLH